MGAALPLCRASLTARGSMIIKGSSTNFGPGKDALWCCTWRWNPLPISVTGCSFLTSFGDFGWFSGTLRISSLVPSTPVDL